MLDMHITISVAVVLVIILSAFIIGIIAGIKLSSASGSRYR